MGVVDDAALMMGAAEGRDVAVKGVVLVVVSRQR